MRQQLKRLINFKYKILKFGVKQLVLRDEMKVLWDHPRLHSPVRKYQQIINGTYQWAKMHQHRCPQLQFFHVTWRKRKRMILKTMPITCPLSIVQIATRKTALETKIIKIRNMIKIQIIGVGRAKVKSIKAVEDPQHLMISKEIQCIIEIDLQTLPFLPHQTIEVVI